MQIQPIETERLYIRHFELQDWEAVYAYTADATVMSFIPEGQFTEAQSRQFVEKNSGVEAEAFPVILKAQNKLIGHLIFHSWFAPQTYEIGWLFHPTYQGHGYATESAQALLQYCFENLKCHRVIATCQPENPASFRVMEKIGMKREGHFRKCIHRGENNWWDEFFYAILDEEWFKRNPNLRM
jgi:[ribosomal protein S5]-alanine N-acetyltransferase